MDLEVIYSGLLELCLSWPKTKGSFIYQYITSLLHGSVFIHLIDMSLIQVYKEHNVIAEHRQSVHCGHFDDERKQI